MECLPALRCLLVFWLSAQVLNLSVAANFEGQILVQITENNSIQTVKGHHGTSAVRSPPGRSIGILVSGSNLFIQRMVPDNGEFFVHLEENEIYTIVY